MFLKKHMLILREQYVNFYNKYKLIYLYINYMYYKKLHIALLRETYVFQKQIMFFNKINFHYYKKYKLFSYYKIL